MASGATGMAHAGTANLLGTLAFGDGSAGQAYLRSPALSGGVGAARNLADAAHYLCVLHGRQPSIVDLALEREITGFAAPWLMQAAAALAAERALLTRLVVAAGPLPSTPGQAECEATVLGQRHALEMLARSDRAGCALGAAIALVIDWHAIRGVLDQAGARFAVDTGVTELPAIAEACALADAVSPSLERALLFGAQQVFAQHRGLWNLLEARELARRNM